MTAASVATRPASRAHLRLVVSGQDGGQMTALATRVAAESDRLIDRTSECVAEAREALGMTAAEFADWLAPLLGWSHGMLPSTVTAWEEDVTPPGDVLMLALTVLGDGVCP